MCLQLAIVQRPAHTKLIIVDQFFSAAYLGKKGCAVSFCAAFSALLIVIIMLVVE